MPCDADVDALRREIYGHSSYKGALEHSTLTLYKVGVQPDNLDIEPTENLRERALDWLREDTPRNPMQPARRLSKYFPEGPTPEDKDMIDIIALAESTVVPAKRSHPTEEPSEAGSRRIRKLGENEAILGERSRASYKEAPEADDERKRLGQRELELRPVCFPTEAGKVFHKDPGAFGWQFEPVDEWWNFYFFWTNQSFDTEFRKSVIPLATNKQDLDDPNHRLSNLPETCGCLYVLPFYQSLTERMFRFRREDREKGIVLSGQPGTGKTTWLWYMLICCLMKYENVVFHYQADTRFFFEGRVYRAMRSNASLIEKGVFSWSLIDLDRREEGPPEFLTGKGVHILPIQAASPNPKRYFHWLKQRNGYVWGMPLWTLDEMMQGFKVHEKFTPFMSTLYEALKSVKGEAGRQACTVLSTVTQEESKPARTESDDSDENKAMLVDSYATKGMNVFVKEDAIRNAMRFAKDDKGNWNNAETVFELLVKDAVHQYGEAVRDITSAVFDGFAQAEEKYQAALNLDKATIDALTDALACIGTERASNLESISHRLFSVEPVKEARLSNKNDTFIPKFKSDRIGEIFMEKEVGSLKLTPAIY
ncbi:uncharacterized protein FOMMEDRAFT_160136 [Fomitiporia mediterranea MF3/22]|uniref:uncharacterized protein n=1 Tax=Fomitiporia mediterranea (strain MF3/22) TaxID=694068 RepID=UPI0004408C8F|nr:uncharacterized protein FOMMEDRAFT_160136 [Fomitiporia mediterranea MF3/22]EJC99708.1 hypothetical protein FOMMEDRAFT_160136 [Fomitiporia mediterranea MF3/22]